MRNLDIITEDLEVNGELCPVEKEIDFIEKISILRKTTFVPLHPPGLTSMVRN